jgi:hypothetical protein
MVAFGRLSYYEKTNLENFDWTDREGSRRCSRRTSLSHISAGDFQLIDPSDAYYKRGFANMAVSLTIHLWSRCVHLTLMICLIYTLVARYFGGVEFNTSEKMVGE